MRSLKEYFNNPKIILYSLNNHGWLRFMSDRANIRLFYRLEKGKRLDLKHPTTFNEKLQWLKIFDHNPNHSLMVDKIKAKTMIKHMIGEDFIVPILGVWNNASQIDFNELPDKFVLKCNHDQGSVVLVHDKKTINRAEIVKFLNRHLKINNYFKTREYPYKNIERKVFAEQYLGDNIRDYKFYCFNGTPCFLYVGQGLTIDHSLKIDYFDMNWKPMPFYRTDYERLGMVEKPVHFEEMIEIATILSKDVPFVRVDLFEADNQVYFSEYSLCPASGFMPFVPDEYDAIVGSWLKLQRYDKHNKCYVDVD